MEKKGIASEKGIGNSEGIKNLKKTIGVFEATFLVVGIVIGSGIFYKPTAVLSAIGAPGMALVIWFLGGLLTLAGSLTLAEIGSAIPKTGGLYIYLKELFGDRMAFLFGWVQVLVYYPGLSAALAVILATQTTAFIPLNEWEQKILAVFYLLFIMTVNIISTKFATKFNVLFTIGKLIPIILIAIFGLILGKANNFSPMVPVNGITGGGFSAALLGVLFGYEGWIAVANLSGEIKNPQKDYPKAILFGILIITIAYLGVNVGVFNTMTTQEIVNSEKVVSDAAVILFGNIGSKVISFGILISIVGSLSGFLMSSGRLPYAMAQEKMIVFPSFFGKIYKKGDTPLGSIVFITALSIIYIFTGSYNTLTDLSVFVTWMFLIVGMYGIFVLRNKREDLASKSDYKVPLYPFVPIIGILGASYVVISTLISGAKMAIFGVIIMFIGLPVYEYLKKKNQSLN